METENPLPWSFGPPPSLGWWPAQYTGFGKDVPTYHCNLYRWWDGEYWSAPAGPWRTAEQTAVKAAVKGKPSEQPLIAWLPRPSSWPEYSLT